MSSSADSTFSSLIQLMEYCTICSTLKTLNTAKFHKDYKSKLSCEPIVHLDIQLSIELKLTCIHSKQVPRSTLFLLEVCQKKQQTEICFMHELIPLAQQIQVSLLQAGDFFVTEEMHYKERQILLSAGGPLLLLQKTKAWLS